jgi:hypothetical protein
MSSPYNYSYLGFLENSIFGTKQKNRGVPVWDVPATIWQPVTGPAVEQAKATLTTAVEQELGNRGKTGWRIARVEAVRSSTDSLHVLWNVAVTPYAARPDVSTRLVRNSETTAIALAAMKSPGVKAQRLIRHLDVKLAIA